VVPARLIDLGSQALVAVSTSAARGGPIVRCQLLASRFYEALMQELHATPSTEAAKRAILLAAADQCCRGSTPHTSPDALLRELKTALECCRSDLWRDHRRSGRGRYFGYSKVDSRQEINRLAGSFSPWGVQRFQQRGSVRRIAYLLTLQARRSIPHFGAARPSG
jgi:hypothetical protein